MSDGEWKLSIHGACIEHVLELDPCGHVLVATAPEACARDDDWHVVVPVLVETPEGESVDVDVPADILAEALRTRGWTCEPPEP